MLAVALVALSILMHQTDATYICLEMHQRQRVAVALTMVCLLSGVISFVIYSIEKRKKASLFLGLLLIPFLAGVLGSGNPQWCRYLYMYQVYVDPLSLHQTLCPRNYTGKWTEWYPNGRKKSQRNLKDGILHGTPAKIEWYPSGQMKSKKDYMDGRLHGKLIEWGALGSVVRLEHYEKGERIESK
jgi:hypothetical protein